jgi:hypothetical protein
MAAPTFDRNRPHGTVFGDPEGRIYHQGDHFFRGDGTLWTEQATAQPDADEPAKPVSTKKKTAAAADPAPAAVDAQLDAQMGAA